MALAAGATVPIPVLPFLNHSNGIASGSTIAIAQLKNSISD
jgi:hypothetical protein